MFLIEDFIGGDVRHPDWKLAQIPCSGSGFFEEKIIRDLVVESPPPCHDSWFEY